MLCQNQEVVERNNIFLFTFYSVYTHCIHSHSDRKDVAKQNKAISNEKKRNEIKKRREKEIPVKSYVCEHTFNTEILVLTFKLRNKRIKQKAERRKNVSS